MPLEMKLLPLGRVPRPELAHEYDAIAGIQEHLGGATGRAGIGHVVFPVGNADVADAGPRCGESPRLSTRFVVDSNAKVPGSVGECCEGPLAEACRRTYAQCRVT